MMARLGRKRWVCLVCIGAFALAGCDRQGGEGNRISNETQKSPGEEPAVALPGPEPALDRQALLEAIARAGSAFAAGSDDRAAQAEIAGRQFAFRIPFGCSGPRAENGSETLAWSYDRERGSLKVTAKPDLTRESAWVEAVSGPQVEAVQGFWIERPWLLTAACRPGQLAASPQERQLEVGIAQFFTAEDSRVQLRSRPFEVVQKLDEKNIPGPRGLHLILTGRLKELPDRRVIACFGTHPGRRPVCIASVEFDRISVEDAATRSVIAEWGFG